MFVSVTQMCQNAHAIALYFKNKVVGKQDVVKVVFCLCPLSLSLFLSAFVDAMIQCNSDPHEEMIFHAILIFQMNNPTKAALLFLCKPLLPQVNQTENEEDGTIQIL